MPASTVDRRPLYPDGDVDASARTATTAAGRFAWMDLAACRDADPELFFPKRGGKTAAAGRICASCPVQAECGAFALQTQTNYDDDHGVFGGQTRRARLAIRAGHGAPGASERSATSQPSTAAERPVQGSRFYRDQAAAVEAFKLAEQIGGINEAARRLGVGTATLYRAWRRWGLGIPDTSRSPARWQRQLHAGGDRQRTFRVLERQRHQLSGQGRQHPGSRDPASDQVV